MKIKLTIWQKIKLLIFQKVEIRDGVWLYRGIKYAGKDFPLLIEEERSDEDEIREYFRKRKDFINDFTRVTRRDK